MTPTVLALDLSVTATGVCLPDGSTTTIRPKTDGDRRLLEIDHAITDLFAEHDPALVVLEDFVVRSGAASALGMVHGVVRCFLWDFAWPYLCVPPATLKVYACGTGRAQKPDMRMSLFKRTGLDLADDNQVDAAWLRYLALDLAGHTLLALPQTHRRALDRLTLPAMEAR